MKGDQPGLFMYQQPRTGLLFNTAGGRPALALMNNGTPVWSATGDTAPRTWTCQSATTCMQVNFSR